jgi:hypothetical protein
MKFVVKDTIGRRCIIKEDGQKMYEAIRGSLQNGETVTLDFDGVQQFAAPFFNVAIGLLLHDMAAADLRRLLHMEHLNTTGQGVVERVLENAVQYHGDKAYRTLVNAILEQQATESA